MKYFMHGLLLGSMYIQKILEQSQNIAVRTWHMANYKPRSH